MELKLEAEKERVGLKEKLNRRRRDKMEVENFILTCPNCGAKNRIPRQRIHDRPICGRCHNPIPFPGKFPDYPMEVTDRTFQQEILSFPGPAVMHGYGPRCGYSRMTMPILAQLARQYAGRVKFAQLNVETNPATAGRFTIEGTPTLLFFKSGVLVNRQVGALPREEIERLVRNMI
jgi:thioredoxin 2